MSDNGVVYPFLSPLKGEQDHPTPSKIKQTYSNINQIAQLQTQCVGLQSDLTHGA